MPDLKTLAIAIVVAIAAGFAAAWTIQDWRIDSIKAEYIEDKAKAVQEEYDRANQISNDYAKVVTWLNEQRQRRTQSVRVEVQKPEYANPDCIRPESGRMLLNDAVRQANAARLPDATLSQVVRDAGERNDGRSDAMGVKPSGGLHGLRVK